MPDYAQQTVRIADLAADTPILQGLEFDHCEIVGPAVVIPSGCTFVRCSYGFLNDDLGTLVWHLPPERPLMQGAVVLHGCSFTDCGFRRVGIALEPEDVPGFLDLIETEAGPAVQAQGAGTPVAS